MTLSGPEQHITLRLSNTSNVDAFAIPRNKLSSLVVDSPVGSAFVGLVTVNLLPMVIVVLREVLFG